MTVQVKEYQRYRDGGTIEYRDVYGRRYFVAAPIFNDDNIYSEYPYHRSKSELFRKEHLISGIELDIVKHF